MSARRVVEYLVVAGILERKDSEASIISKLVVKLHSLTVLSGCVLDN